MINFGAIAGSMQDREDYYGTQRKDMAAAFAQFKASNPLATQKDFQNFIDSYSGGNNYIGGGAPAKDTLARIAANNQSKENERKRRLAFEDMTSQKEAERLFSDEIKSSLLNMKPSSMRGGEEYFDYGAAYKDFMGANPNLGELNLDLRDMFNAEDRSQLIQQRTRTGAKNAIDWLSSIEDPSTVTATDLAEDFGIPISVANPLFDTAKKRSSDEYESKLQAKKSLITETARKIAQDPSVSPENIIKNIEAEFKGTAFFDDIVKGDQNFLTGIVEKATLDRKNKKSRIQAANLLKLEDRVLPPVVQLQIKNAIREGGMAAAKDVIMKRFGNLVSGEIFEGEEGQALLNETLDSIIKQNIDDNSVSQEARRLELLTTIPKNVTAKITAAREANIKLATDRFAPNIASGNVVGGKANAQQVAVTLASEYNMDNRTIGLLQDFFQSEDLKDVTSVADLTPLARSYLAQNGASRWDTQRLRVQQIEESLIPLEGTNFVSYVQDLNGDISETQDSVRAQIIKIVGQANIQGNSQEALDAFVSRLRLLESQYKDWKSDLKTKVQNHKDTKLNWLDIGGEVWNDGVVGNALNGSEWNMSELNSAIEEIEGITPTSVAVTPNRLDSRTQNVQLEDRRKAFQTVIKSVPKYQGIEINKFSLWGDPFGDFTDAEIKVKEQIKELWSNQRARNIWLEKGLDAEGFNYGEFYRDPETFIRTNPKAKEILDSLPR